jgi:hypothetical protein
VAHLVREIIADDPVAQILITAQAHGAVDVLRAKVRDEAFKDIPREQQPLSIRLGSRGADNEITEDSKEDVGLRVLKSARERIGKMGNRMPLQERWLEAIDHLLKGSEASQWQDVPTTGDLSPWQEQLLAMRKQLVSEPSADVSEGQWGQSWNDFCELVRRGASLTYCTTSAGDLEELAEGRQAFDWSIIEEAGKAHGFDLALPLGAGHRWLLIGDQNQLPPYRFEDYSNLIDHLDEAIEALNGLGLGPALLDFEWVQRWRALETPEHRQSFKSYATTWLNTFTQIFDYCHQATGRKTTARALGALSGMLQGQYRMHPTIGDLISKAYYCSELVNQTVEPNGAPKATVLHPFVRPTGISGKAIVWIDVPWAAENPAVKEQLPQYTNPAEVRVLGAFLRKLERSGEGLDVNGPLLKLVALSPYTQQVIAINRAHSRGEIRLPGGVEPTDDVRARRHADTAGRPQLAYTVDSFQGNQADIVVVSLVRNNERTAGGGLGFLSNSARINVLLSRAQRLLVLIGSWKFFHHQVSGVNPADPSAPLWHWWQVLTLLEEWFPSERALKIDAASLETLP